MANPKTVLKSISGVSNEYEFSGTITKQTLIDAEVLESADGQALIPLREIEIGTDVTGIGPSVFESFGTVRSIVIPSSVETIGSNAFDCAGNDNLESVTFIGRTIDQVQGMDNYPWGINNTSVINVA